MSRFKSFVNNNLVVIVMIPALIGIHWGWYQLHQNEALVPANERKEMPLFKMISKGRSRISGGEPKKGE
ncbi:hypothetical protein RP20_CCG013073 [Aedes albopictus]|nr:hypothetical protein RP20_CCG013073 [Aedes albopictus]